MIKFAAILAVFSFYLSVTDAHAQGQCFFNGQRWVLQYPNGYFGLCPSQMIPAPQILPYPGPVQAPNVRPAPPVLPYPTFAAPPPLPEESPVNPYGRQQAVQPRFQSEERPERSSSASLAVDCARQSSTRIDAFLQCSGGKVVLNPDQRVLVDCAESSGTTAQGLAECAGPKLLGRHVSQDQRALLKCAYDAEGRSNAFVSCMSAYGVSRLSTEQRAVLTCAADSDSSSEFATCAGSQLIGSRLNPEQRAAVACAAESGGSATGFATCAGTKILGANLNPEQRIAIACVAETGGQPYAAAACAAIKLTIRELQKCLSEGFNSRNCYGKNNDLFGREGWTVKTLTNAGNDLVHGPGETNDLVGCRGWLAKRMGRRC